MPIDPARFREFLEVSTRWTLRDQRYVAAIGFELLICDEAFSRLYAECERLTDSAIERWSIDEATSSHLVILARAFVDHSVRSQKLVRKYSRATGRLAEYAEAFFQHNGDLFAVRDATHHIDSRIDSNEPFEHLQPLNGELSWLHLTSAHSFDLYWITLGTIAGGEWASPAFQSTMQFRHPIDHLRYRAHGREVDLGTGYLNTLDFLTRVHDLLVETLTSHAETEDFPVEGEQHPRLPRHFNGRIRVAPEENSSESTAAPDS